MSNGSAEPFDVCVIGSANLDLVATTSRIPAPGETVLGHGYAQHAGGKGLNQAVAAARAGARVAFVGAVGSDVAGLDLLAVMERAGVDVSAVEVADGPTGRALISVADTGENSIIVVAGANAKVTAARLPTARVVLAQLEVPLPAVSEALAAARAAGAMTVLNPAPAQALDSALLGVCDIVIPNEHEVELLGGPAVLLALGTTAVIVTRGAAGSEVHSAAGTVRFDAFPVDVVDTTAAGDAFCGALCARLAAGDHLDRAMRFASAAGALATTVEGAVPSLPERTAIDELVGDGVDQGHRINGEG